jgi:hypothetical protein
MTTYARLTITLAAVILVGCAKLEHQPVVPIDKPTAPIEQLKTYPGRWSCQEYPRTNHFAKACSVEVTVDTSGVESWMRIGCFGEITFTQVIDGKVSQVRQGFFESITQPEPSEFPKSFRLVAWVNFPAGYEALDPKPAWYQCKILSPGDDMQFL